MRDWRRRNEIKQRMSVPIFEFQILKAYTHQAFRDEMELFCLREKVDLKIETTTNDFLSRYVLVNEDGKEIFSRIYSTQHYLGRTPEYILIHIQIRAHSFIEQATLTIERLLRTGR